MLFKSQRTRDEVRMYGSLRFTILILHRIEYSQLVFGRYAMAYMAKQIIWITIIRESSSTQLLSTVMAAVVRLTLLEA
jgi:hypothetical protein